jgi:hypothetical protein
MISSPQAYRAVVAAAAKLHTAALTIHAGPLHLHTAVQQLRVLELLELLVGDLAAIILGDGTTVRAWRSGQERSGDSDLDDLSLCGVSS